MARPETNRPLRVVVADDHPQMRQMLSLLLGTEPDFEVVAQAADGEEAIAATCAHQPDLTLLDLNMPRRDGFEVLSELGSRCPGVTTAILSGQPRELHERRALDLGAELYLEKSAAMGNDLVDALRGLLGRPSHGHTITA